MVSIFEFRCSGFGLRGSNLQLCGDECVSGFGFRGGSFGVRVSGFGFRDSGFGVRTFHSAEMNVRISAASTSASCPCNRRTSRVNRERVQPRGDCGTHKTVGQILARSDSGLSLQEKVLESIKVVPTSLESGPWWPRALHSPKSALNSRLSTRSRRPYSPKASPQHVDGQRESEHLGESTPYSGRGGKCLGEHPTPASQEPKDSTPNPFTPLPKPYALNPNSTHLPLTSHTYFVRRQGPP